MQNEGKSGILTVASTSEIVDSVYVLTKDLHYQFFLINWEYPWLQHTKLCMMAKPFYGMSLAQFQIDYLFHPVIIVLVYFALF